MVKKRKELDDQGLDAGAATIWSHLSNGLLAGTAVPSEATIWRILTHRGFIIPEPKKAPKHAHRTFAAERANECWQLDDIKWELLDGPEVKIITLIDDCTRLCPGLKAVISANGEAAFDTFSTAAERHGWPQRFLSDNAKAYKISLAAAVGVLGVDHRHGRPNHPQTQGKVERFHQTLQKWLKAQPRAASLEELQARSPESTWASGVVTGPIIDRGRSPQGRTANMTVARHGTTNAQIRLPGCTLRKDPFDGWMSDTSKGFEWVLDKIRVRDRPPDLMTPAMTPVGKSHAYSRGTRSHTGSRF